MTLDQAYQQNKGTAILVPGGGSGNAGQCEQWADYVLFNVYGKPYLYTPGAINWWLNPTLEKEGFKFISIASGVYPLKGDFVVWGSGVGSQYGHIDLCSQDGDGAGFMGYDSNWGDSGILQEITHNYGFDILGYIRLEESMPQLQPGDIDKAIKGMLGRQPTAEELGNQDYANNAALLIETLWNNGGEARFNNLDPQYKPYSGPQLYESA